LDVHFVASAGLPVILT